MNRVIVVITSLLILFCGCSSDKEPAEQTVDPQAQIQSRLDMEKWLLDTRYVHHISSQAADVIKTTISSNQEGDSRMALAAVVDHFKAPSGLISNLNSLMYKMKSEEQRLAGIPEKDVRIYDNLKICNNLNTEKINLISTLPDPISSFSENLERIDNQLNSIVKILMIEFPQSTDDLNAMISDDNMDYRAMVRMIREVPTPVPAPIETTEPVSDVEPPSPTPTTPPVLTWRDSNGVIHMGYYPPEGAEIIQIQSQLSGSVETTEPIETEPAPDTSKSMIWVDKDGVTHMGHQVPEGYESKPADEIPLMIGN